jgi:hypothetical protein
MLALLFELILNISVEISIIFAAIMAVSKPTDCKRLKIGMIYEKMLTGIDFLNLHRLEVVEPLCSDGASWSADHGS